MKQRILLLPFFILLASLLFACDNTVPTPGTTVGTETATTDATETETDGMIDLTKYTLMRADNAKQPLLSDIVAFRQTINALCGMDMPIATDYVGKNINNRTEYEFIIGHTNIPEENAIYETLGAGESAIQIVGNKIILVGDTDETTRATLAYFLKKYLGYDPDKYTNAPIGTTALAIEDERMVIENGQFPVLRTEALDAAPAGEPLEINRKTFTPAGCAIEDGVIRFANATGTASSRIKSGEGSYSLRFTVDIETDGMPIIQMFFNNGGKSDHVVLSVNGNHVGVGRSDYERGGADFDGDPRHYTLRADVYPSAGCMRYYVNDVLLGEMNIADNDPTLNENTQFSAAAVNVGADYTATISDFYLVPIPDIEPRRYDAITTDIGDEEVYPGSAHAPAETIYVVDPAPLNDDELLTLVTLQGNVNRTTPEIFVDYRKYNNDPRFWDIDNEAEYLTLLESKGRTLVTATLDELLVRFADRYDGIIIGEAFGVNDYEENIVTTLCGVLDGVYLTEKAYTDIKADIQKDVLFRTAGKFASAVDAYMWVWQNYGERCSKDVLFHMPTCSDDYSHPTLICRDYAVMSRAFVFCTDDVRNLADYDFYMSLFASTKPNTGIIGQGGGCFPEFEMFQICGQFGKYFTYGFSTPNMSLFNSLEVGELQQPEQVVPELENDTVYVAFDLSEGDNLSWDYHLWMHDYDDVAGRAAVAKGYSICGALYYVAPAILEYYYANATPNDNFFLDGGGISNCSSPDDFAILYKPADREKIVTRMLELVEYVCQKTDIHVIRAIHNISDEMTARYDTECPSLEAVLSAYGNLTHRIGGTGGNYKLGTYMVGDIVRERCAYTTFRDDIANQIVLGTKKLKNEDNIYFARVFVYANPMLDNLAYFTDLRDQLAKLPYNVQIVTPEVYAALYKEWVQ